jgi:ferredoxin
MSKYKIDKDKCIGCGLCVAQCDGGTELGDDGKAKVIDSDKLEKCDGENVCPYGAIRKES